MRYLTTALAGLFFSTALAAESVNKTIDADSDSEVTIINTAGSVEVRGWSRNEVEVTGNLGSGVEELVFERDDEEILIHVKVPRRHARSVSSDLVINIPEKSELEVNTVSADIDVENVLGEQQLESVSGDIKMFAHDNEIDAGSVSGDIEIEGHGQDIEANFGTVSGDVDADNLAGELRVDSVSGDITVINSHFERASLETVNGSITHHAGLDGDGRLRIETINGSVDVDFGGDVSARFDIETFNGKIRNCFGPEPVRTSRYAPGYELKFTEGGGSGRVDIQTLNGRLRLCK